MIPILVVAYVIVSRRRGTVCQYNIMEGRDKIFFTRVGQERDNGLRVADLRFWELE